MFSVKQEMVILEMEKLSFLQKEDLTRFSIQQLPPKKAILLHRYYCLHKTDKMIGESKTFHTTSHVIFRRRKEIHQELSEIMMDNFLNARGFNADRTQ